MRSTNKLVLFTIVASIMTVCLVTGAALAQTSTVITTDLLRPNKVILAPDNSLLISEDGTDVANTGRISVVDRTTGVRHTLMSGFPSALNPLGGNEPDGVTGLYLQGNVLWITIGSGDAAMPGPGPGLELPNPNPSSDLFTSVLEITLPGGFTQLDSPFELTASDRTSIAVNGGVKVQNADGYSAMVRLVADLPDYVPAPTMTNPDNVKASHLFGLTRFQKDLYVVDAGRNLIHRVGLKTANHSVFVAFPNKPNPLFPTLGGPFVESVPDNIHRFGNRLLVPLLTGFPFVSGLAEIRAVELKTGENVGFIPNLTTAMDITKADGDEEEIAPGDGNAFFTLEFSTSFLAGAPGRLRYYSSPTAIPEDVLTNLITPTSLALEGKTGNIFITNIGPGTLTRVVLDAPFTSPIGRK